MLTTEDRTDLTSIFDKVQDFAAALERCESVNGIGEEVGELAAHRNYRMVANWRHAS